MKFIKYALPVVLIAGLMTIACKNTQEISTTGQVTKDNYRRAESMLSTSTSKLIYRSSVRPVWVGDDHFWYSVRTRDGLKYWIVDAATQTKSQLFTSREMSKLLLNEGVEIADKDNLRLSDLLFDDSFSSFTFEYSGDKFRYMEGSLKKEGKSLHYSNDAILSPDGFKEAFIRDYNLWVRNLATGKETQLTTDGVKDYGYATNNAGWTRRSTPVLLWSPDSKMIATFKHDGRGVGEMYMATTNVGHPRLEAWKYPLPGDSLVFRIERVIIHLDGPKVIKLKMPPDAHRSTITDHIATRGGKLADAEWNADATKLAFVSTSRNHRDEYFRVADPITGEVRDVFEEHVDDFYESGYNSINWKFLDESGEVLWYSNRNNWGHLYLYDLETGNLKSQVTDGQWNVLQVLKVDQDNRRIWFTGNCREEGDPYFMYLYSVKMDGTDLLLVTPDSANHSVSLSPDANWYVDSYSTPVNPPITYLASTSGEQILAIEEAEISELQKSGWVAPEPFIVKARDGKTDLYGLMYKPSNFDPGKKYPIINYIYPGPQTGSVGSRSFSASRGDRQSIAELGFIVVAIDAMGTPMRSHSFHAAYYGDMGDNGLPDQIAGMKQLAERYPWIDIDRVGIYGHSGGGFASTDAILRYPDFFKVAVSGAGNHDNRNYEDDWGEKWQGLLETLEDGTTNYDDQANQSMADNLKGRLLLAHGTMDTNVPFYNTLLVVNELIAANKDFDLILFPNRSHGFGNEPYMLRRRWDYFVKNLMGAEPPVEYDFPTLAGR